MSRTIVLAFVPLMLLAGCASMFADKECTDGKWHDVGYRDGSEGRNLVEHWRSNCGTWDIGIDAASYDRGYRDGVARVYCTPDKALAEGKAGRGFDGQLCGARKDLQARYETGLREYCTPQVAYEVGGRADRYEFERCGKAGTDLKRAYQDGVTNVYCRPADAYRAGRNDEKFQLSLCPPTSESAYRTGLEIRTLNKSVSEIDSDLYEQKRKRDDKNAKDDERRYAEHRVRDLERERRRLREKLDTLERIGRNY
jgi:hypothetical protein